MHLPCTFLSKSDQICFQFLSYITKPSSTPFFHLHKLNNNLTIFEPCITRNIRILSIFLLIFVATMVQPIQLHYLIAEKNETNLTSTSSLFGFIDFFLYSTFFIRIHKFFSNFRFFLLCHFHSGDSEKQATETEFNQQENEPSVSCRESGEIERDEVKMVMEKLGIFCSSESEELEEKYGSKELSELFEEQEPSLKEVKMAFDVFDENKDGFIDAKELQRVLCILGLKEVSEFENCQKMIRNFDGNHDGRIDFIEFVKIMESRFC